MRATKLTCSVIALAMMLAGCAEKKIAVVPEAPPPLPPPKPRPFKKQPPPSPPPLLSPQVGEEEEGRIKQEVYARIEGAELAVKSIDPSKLGNDQQGTFLTVQSFISKAKDAVSIKDFLRASNLADKAQVLAEELLHSLR